MQVVFNNLLFLFLWKLFFTVFPFFGGWTWQDMRLLIACGTGSLGLMFVFFGGVKKMPDFIRLCQTSRPALTSKAPLFTLLCGSSIPSGWGHLATSLFCFMLGDLSLIPLAFVYMTLACFLLTATHTLLYSLLFWCRAGSWIAIYEELFLLLSLYPIPHKNMCLLLLFPAGCVGTLPVTLLRTFSWSPFFIFLTSTSLFCFLAFIVFFFGCKKYQAQTLH
ncbi:MAG: hypothetical protein FJZ58_00730 [Chlamydiae bacterium]|nr:hypothetical protein [Chlamydiota bacterium]